MNVKEFLLSLDAKTLWRRHYEDYFKNNVVMQAEAEQGGYDLETTNEKNFFHFMSQIKDVEVIPSDNEYLIVVAYKDYEYNDNWDTEIFTTFDAFLLDKKECINHGELPQISKLSDAYKDFIWANYSLMFIPWENILGMEICYLPEDIYGAASAIVNELTFFGFDKKRNDSNIQEETAKLEEAEREIEEGAVDYVPLDLEDLRKQLGLPKETAEEKQRIKELNDKLMLDNYNESIKVYNILREAGFFD